MKVVWSLSALIALAVLIPTMLLAVAVWREFGHVLHNAETTASHSAALLTQHVEKVMESNDLILDRVLERVSGKDWAAVDYEERGLHEFLHAIAHASPQVSNILLFDAEGTPRAQALRYPAPRNVNVSDRDYFVEHKASNRGTFVSKLIRGRTTGSLVFGVSRRLSDPNGDFAGIIFVGTRESYFSEVWKNLLRSDDAAMLVRTDGEILVRNPPLHEPVRLPLGDPMLRAIQTGSPDIIHFTSPIDDVRRIASHRHVEGQPLHLVVKLSYSAMLRSWWRSVAFYLILTALLATTLTIAILIVGRKRSTEQAAIIEARREQGRREQAEAALVQAQKTEALGLLAGGIVHDFNNLLHIARSTLVTVRDRPSDQKLDERVAVALSALDKGEDLTRRLLAFSREGPPRPVIVRPTEAIQNLLPLLAQPLKGKIVLETIYDPDVWPVAIDLNQFEMGLLNVVINARDAMPDGGNLKIAVRNCDHGSDRRSPVAGDCVVISIADNGIGMSPEVLQKALTPFYTTKKEGMGTGLGLAILNQLAQQSGGDVRIESELGRGTTVHLFLPKAIEEHASENGENVIPLFKPV